MINPMVQGEAQGIVFGGNGSLLVKQILAGLGSGAYAFIFTYLMLILINFITPVKVSKEEELQGIDIAIHGEKAYDEGSL
jgi:Amt family ammonium transporter